MSDARTAEIRGVMGRLTRPMALCVFVFALLGLADALGQLGIWTGADSNFGMKVNSAISLAAVSLALALWREDASRRRRVLVVGLACLAGVVGGATLVEWFTGVDLGIDQLWTANARPNAYFPGRMAPSTAMSLVLASLSVALLNTKRRRPVALGITAATAIMFIVVLALVGFIYGVGPYLGLARFTTQMRLPTAIALTGLSIALQAARPKLGLLGLATETGPSGVLMRWLAIPAVVVPVTVGWWSQQAEAAGQITDDLGAAFVAVANVVTFVGLTVLGAHGVRRQDQARRSAAQALRAAHDALEERVAERTAELSKTNLDLERAREQAVHAMRARSEFLARMSHEIRTPLNGVLGMIALAADTELSAEQHQLLLTADASAQQLLGLVEEILDFAKIDAGKLKLEAIPFSLQAAVATALRGLAHGARSKGLELLIDVERDVPDDLVGDPKRLQQVLVNLVANAVRFTDVGEVVLQIALAPPVPPVPPDPADPAAAATTSVALMFRVIDTGIGIPPEKQGVIFEAFTQSEAATTRKYGGTGLGLAICSELVQLMDGTIGVQSHLGRGSTFAFSARFELAPGASLAPRPHRPTGLVGAPVLVVDDHATSRRILAEVAQRWGAQVTAMSGPALVATNEVGAPDGRPYALVLVDLAAAVTPERLAALAGAAPIIGIAREAVGSAATPGGRFAAWVPKPATPNILFEAAEGALLGIPQPTTGGRARPTSRTEHPLDVLVVEDNATNARLVTLTLERVGHRSVSVHTGREALTALSRAAFDVVLMDVQMPEMDGLDATRTIRAGEAVQGGHVPVIGLSAQAMAGDAERCLAVGMDAYLTKPIDPVRLVALIEQLASAAKGAVPFVRAQLLARVGGDDELLAEVIALFSSELPGMQRVLEDRVAASDWAAVARQAHTLKGALLNVAAEPAALVAQRIEDACREREVQPEAVQALVSELQARLMMLKAALVAVVPPFAGARTSQPRADQEHGSAR